MSSRTRLEARSRIEDFRADVIRGLSRRPRRLPCKYFYDRRGSTLFDRLCRLDEYYLTRTELSIMRRYALEIAEAIGPRACLIELGSGSSEKTRVLLDHLPDVAVYVPVDISGEHLQSAVVRLVKDYPALPIAPVCADFTRAVSLPRSGWLCRRRVVYFPGSTIGNFVRPEARRLLSRVARLAKPGGSVLLGVDLVKERRTIELAYNDAAGVTAAFNLNLLGRINRELDANFDLAAFHHSAIYNADRQRIEMYLTSDGAQTVYVGESPFDFEAGERICTEHSHKYTIDSLLALTATTGLRLQKVWTDPRQWFAVLHFSVA